MHDALSKSNKRIIDIGCKANMIYEYAETEAKNFGAMNIMKNKYGVTNRRWTDDQLAVFEKAWMEVVSEESARDKTFKEFADSFYAFRENYKIWGEAQSLKPTYLK